MADTTISCVRTCTVDSVHYSGCVVCGASAIAAVKVLLFTAAQDYAYLELNSSITERLRQLPAWQSSQLLSESH